MAVKWSTPGIGFREIDNTVRPNADPGDGIGAIVLNANRGYPNQRILCTTIDKFHEFFGTPDNPNQYGHFAAQVYFDQGGATQLLVVRATMGDEGYAQIQYPYTDAGEDKNKDANSETLSFVDNEMLNNIKIIDAITDQYDGSRAAADGFTPYVLGSNTYEYYGKSKRAIIKDIFKEYNGNPTEEIYVYRDRADSGKTAGKAVQVDISGAGSQRGFLFAVSTTDYAANLKKKSTIPSTQDPRSVLYYYQDTVPHDVGTGSSAVHYYETIIHIPAKNSLNGSEVSALLYATKIDTATTTIATILAAALNGDTATNDGIVQKKKDVVDCTRLELVDWDDGYTKTFVVKTTDLTTDPTYSEKDVFGLEYTEYGTADSNYVLTIAKDTYPKATVCKNADPAKVAEIASEYGLDPSEIASDKYAILEFYPAKDEVYEPLPVLVKMKSEYKDSQSTPTGDAQVVTTVPLSTTQDGKYGSALKYSITWALFLEHGQKKVTTASSYGIKNPEELIKPWQVGLDFDNDGKELVDKIIAISSTEVFSDPTGKWKDGYTAYCKTDAQPGNGDLEMYQSNKANQLIIGAIGPGEFGNDIGISIITPAAAKIPALYGQNAFSWLYKYDDEDKVDAASKDYQDNEENLTWKKVYKINVYVKPATKTQAVWGFGLDALMQSPVESFLVSNDPNAKDDMGNSLWAPYVVNGNSKYIYVSKKSVEQAVNYKGEYAMPEQTFSIYQLTGGTNSKLNNAKEKMRALDLYQNRKKAIADYIFNVEPIDTFSGRQRYKALQDRIAQIAMKRKMDLGFIQATSKEAKTIRQKLSEAKMFSYADGSYVAAYDDYDSYFDPFTSTWVMLPRSVAGAVACCYIDTHANPWEAPAGANYGQIAYSDGPMITLDDDEFGQLYDININSTLDVPGYGVLLMGQKTMLKKESALNRIDIRKLCNFIEKRLERKLFPFLFMKNTTTNRSAMKTAVDTFLGRIQSGQGIISRKVEVVPDPNDTHLVYVNISFVPAEAIERIEVTLTLNREQSTIVSGDRTVPL